MIMMQQAFNEILLNVAQTNGKNKLTFLDSNLIDTNSSTLTSSFIKNNFFSNLVENDYIFDNKENYNLNDGNRSSFESKKNSSPISSGLSSLSSSLSSSSSSPSSYLYGNDTLSSSLSRSSSTCSLLSSTIKQDIKKSSSPHPLSNVLLGNHSSLGTSSSNSSLENILPFNLNQFVVVQQPVSTYQQQFNKSNSMCTESNINWSFILSNSNNNKEEQHGQYTKDFYWNINKLTEMALVNSNIGNIQTGNYFASSLTTNSCNFGMTNNNTSNSNCFNSSNKLARKIVGNSLSQINNGLQQYPVGNNNNKFYSNNQVFYQQQQHQQNNNYINQNKMNNNNNLMFQSQQISCSYNQQLNYCGRANNNRGYPQFC